MLSPLTHQIVAPLGYNCQRLHSFLPNVSAVGCRCLTSKRLDLLVVELHGIGCIFEGLGDCLPWCPPSLQFEDHKIAPSIQGEQINEPAQVCLNLPSDDEKLAVCDNSGRIVLNPVLKNRFLVLNAEARFHVLGEVTLLGYSE